MYVFMYMYIHLLGICLMAFKNFIVIYFIQKKLELCNLLCIFLNFSGSLVTRFV